MNGDLLFALSPLLLEEGRENLPTIRGHHTTNHLALMVHPRVVQQLVD
jgi:hypothetical protein